MPRKDYVALANAFAESRPFVAKRSTAIQRAQYAIWHTTRAEIMRALSADNPRFDRERFISATEQL